jgi:hypothetical protein
MWDERLTDERAVHAQRSTLWFLKGEQDPDSDNMNANDIEDVLLQQIKPVFQSNPHPSLNLSTGRKLARPAGGPLASQDYYEGQTWKQHPEAHIKLQWCVENVKESTKVRLLLSLICSTARGL